MFFSKKESKKEGKPKVGNLKFVNQGREVECWSDYKALFHASQ